MDNRLIEIMDAEQKREKRLKKMKRVLENSGTTFNEPTLVLQGCHKEKKERRIFQEIIAENFPHM